MGVQGDLGTLELSDLLQNLELHKKSGTLVVQTETDSASFYFDEGRLTLFGAPDRPSLMEVLVGSGLVTAEGLDRARKKRKRTRKSLGEVLVELEEVDHEALVELARSRLLSDTCEVIVSTYGEFQFTPGGVPRGVFDPEERRLNLGLPVGPLLLEAARREDHWQMIRSRIPSDTAHHKLVRQPRVEGSPETQGLAQALLERLDGTQSVGEVLAPFPHQRFEAYQLLADFAEQGAIRLIGPDDMARMAREIETFDPERAWSLLTRGLSRDPQNVDLLSESARAAEDRGEVDQAVDALKMLAHLCAESDRTADASDALSRAAKLAPGDTAIAERRLDLALLEDAIDEATAVGLQLVELYRAPGLHKKAAEILESLLEKDPTSWRIRRELARSRAAAGDLTEALAGLERYARRELSEERYLTAREGFAEMLDLDPSQEAVERLVEEIDSGATARKREQRRRLIVRSIGVGTLVLMTVATVFEVSGRSAWARADREILEEGMLAEGRVIEAIELLSKVRDRHPLSTASWFDIPNRIGVLSAQLGED
ncbi:MAG: DUF4388 domain-containing protein [Planctomycetota bacterium]